MEWDSKLKDFFVSNEKTKQAVCNLCNKSVSFKTTVINLIQHLALAHPEALLNNFPVVTINQDELSDDDSSPVVMSCDSLSFFETFEGSSTATCALCLQKVSFKTSCSNLEQHLKIKHAEIYKNFISSKSSTPQNGAEEGKNCEENVENSLETDNGSENVSSELVINSEAEIILPSDEDYIIISSKSDTTKRKNTSPVWKIFDRIPNTEVATCTLCQKIISYKSTSNLKSHIWRIHPLAYNIHFVPSKSASSKICSEENNSDAENSHLEINPEDKYLIEKNTLNSSKIMRKIRSNLWNVFDKISNTQTAKCTLCQRIISYKSTRANLTSHLKRIHPVAYQKQFISSKSVISLNGPDKESDFENNNSDEEKSLENNSEDEHLLEDNMLNSSKTKKERKNRSDLWKFFDKIPNTQMATCILCQKKLSYRTTTNNLRHHMKKRHPMFYHSQYILSQSATAQNSSEEGSGEINLYEENSHAENNSEDECLLEENMLKSSKEEKRAAVDLEVARTNRLDVWKVFDRIQNTKMATCTLCQKNMSYKSTTGNLRNHIRRLHPETYLHMSEGHNEIEGATSKNEDFHVGNNSEEKYLHKNSMLNSSGSYKSKINIEITREDNSQQPVKNCSEKFRHNFGNSSRCRNSAILNFFERNDKTKMFRCKLCLNIISYKSTIMHLKRHLKNKHKREYLDYSSRSASPSKNIYEVYISAGEDQEQEDSKQKSTNYNFDKMNQIARDTQMNPFDSEENIIEEPPKKMQRISSINWAYKIQPDERKNIDRYLLKLITEDFQPFNIVKDKGFQEFISVLNPNYQLPTQKTLSTLLAEEYTNKLAKFKEITQSCSSVSLSVDCWSSRNMKSFMTVTAHFINQDTFEFCSVFIQNVGLHKQDTAEDIATQLRQATSKWDIINKVKFIVFDNAPNMVSAARILNWPHFICFANTFNSIVQGALNDISIAEIVAKVQKAVAYIKSTSAAKEMLQEYQVKTQQVAQPKSLASAIPTCWITICKMLKRFSELQKAVRATLPNIDEEIPAITSDEWQCINQLVEILKPFEEAATIMSSEKYLIAGKAVVLVAGLYKVCIDLAERSFCEPVSNLILKLKTDLSTKFGDLEDNEEISVCTLLDPRFKQHAFEDHIAMLNAKESVLVKLKHLNNGHRVGSAGSSSTTISNADSSLLGRFYTKVASSYQPERTEHSRTMDELNRYLSENVIPPTECSLRWWKERRMLYPSLSKIFVDCSNIVVTSLPCDRAFSKTGYILADRLNGLTTAKLDQIMFLNVNK